MEQWSYIHIIVVSGGLCVQTAIMLLKVTNFPHIFSSRGHRFSRLHVEPLRGSLLFPVQHILLRLLEVLLGHLEEKKVENESGPKRESPPSSFSLGEQEDQPQCR